MSCRVLVVESSGVLSKRLADVLAPGCDCVPVGAPVAPAQMLEAVRELTPSLVIAEVGEPGGELARAIELTMAETPTAICLVVQTAAHRQEAISLLAAGALDIAELPRGLTDEQARALGRQFELLAGVKVVKHPRGRRRRTSSRIAAVRGSFPVVAIAASLGGPKALVTVLADLPRDFGAPILVCQHITAGFSGDFARWLESETGLKAHEAEPGERLVKSEIVIAPSNVHLTVTAAGLVGLERTAPVGGFRPSCDVMLKSVATSCGSRAIGVVLTGMGRDGARGLKDVRAKGGHTIAQSEETCVVFGMPKEAIALGGAELVLPLERIAEQLVRWVP